MPSTSTPRAIPGWVRIPLGLAVMAAALLGLLFVLVALVTAVAYPDAFESSQQFCCHAPQAWSEVPVRVASALLTVAVDGALWLIAAWLLDGTGRRRHLWTVLAPVVGGALVLIELGLALGVDDAVPVPDCGDFVVDGAAFRTGDRAARRRQAIGIARCDVVAGRTKAQVRVLLGQPPPEDVPPGVGASPDFSYPEMTVEFRGDRVSSVVIHTDPGFSMD